jgi:uncharacterized protein
VEDTLTPVRFGRALILLLVCALSAQIWGCGKKESPGERLVRAVRDNQLGKVEELLEEGVDANSRDSSSKDARTALYHAAVFGYTDIAKRLLAKGAKVDLGAPASGQTPLMVAAFHENRDMVVLLLNSGAQVNAQDPAGDTPLTQAARKGNAELVSLLINAGAFVDVRTKEGFTALCLAKQSGFAAAIKVLQEAGSPGDC